jgi:hypothetical protein
MIKTWAETQTHTQTHTTDKQQMLKRRQISYLLNMMIEKSKHEKVLTVCGFRLRMIESNVFGGSTVLSVDCPLACSVSVSIRPLIALLQPKASHKIFLRCGFVLFFSVGSVCRFFRLLFFHSLLLAVRFGKRKSNFRDPNRKSSSRPETQNVF